MSYTVSLWLPVERAMLLDDSVRKSLEALGKRLHRRAASAGVYFLGRLREEAAERRGRLQELGADDELCRKS